MLSAVGLHGALIACTAFGWSRTLDRPLPARVRLASQSPAEISVFVEEFDARPSDAEESYSRYATGAPSALARVGSPARLRAPGSTSGGEPEEPAPGTGASGAPEGNGTPSPTAPPKIDFGLDGSIFDAAVLDASRRPPPPRSRSRVVVDDWSASAVRVASDRAAPREGSALVTIEWDSEGRLQSVVTSAHSSEPSRWEKLADSLRASLSRRTRRTPEGRGLRVVYLVSSELVPPQNQRSVLPRVEHGSLEQVPAFMDLPPGAALMFGVKADTSGPVERVVSVTLASSQLL